MSLKEIELRGNVNTPEDVILDHVRRNIARGLPQVKRYGPNPKRIALVGGGPSLADTFDELRAQAFAGDSIVAVNGTYQWLLERNIKPSAMVMVDARDFNVRFLEPNVPGCRYFLASQCHPDAFDLCEREGRDVTIFHCISEAAEQEVLRDYYGEKKFCVVQCGSTGGTTVMLRSIVLFAMLGFFRMDLYGMDSCWLHDQHHAYPQPENDQDRRISVTTIPRQGDTRHEHLARTFICEPWHLRQAEEFQTLVRDLGQHFALNVHGDGLLAHIVKTGASLPEVTTPEKTETTL